MHSACKILCSRRWYVFKPTTINHDSLVVLLSTIQEINSSGNSIKKNENEELEYIHIGKKKKKVSTVPCKLGDVIVYLVGVKNIVDFILFFKEKTSPMQPLGFTTKFLELERRDDSEDVILNNFYLTFGTEKKDIKENRIIYPLKGNIEEIENNKLKNMMVCIWLSDDLQSFNTKSVTSESSVQILKEINENTMSYNEGNFFDSLNCDIFKSDNIQIVEHPTRDEIFVRHGRRLKSYNVTGLRNRPTSSLH